MPFQAAKAIAATFCYNIRWALTPVFGNEFPAICLPPSNPGYAKFVIDHDIVRECTDETSRFRVEGASYQIAAPTMSTEVHTPRLQFGFPPWGPRDAKQAHPRTSEEESGYCTESDHSENFLFSPQVSPRSITWTSINRSPSPTSPVVIHSLNCIPPNKSLPPLHQISPTSVPGGYYDEPLRAKRTLSKVAYGENDTVVEISRPPTGVTTPNTASDPSMDDCRDCIHSLKDLDAAEIMMRLSAADNTLPPTKRTRRGSKY
jgi:hypothetical protein